MKKIISILSFLLLPSTMTGLEVKEGNHLVLEVKGVVCSFCAYGMSKNLSKLPFVNKDLFEKGVFTDIKKGLVTIALKPDEKIDVVKINKKIKKGGYELKGIHLRLAGPISKSDGAVTVKNAFNGQVFVLVGSEVPVGKELTIQGYISKDYIMDIDSEEDIRVRLKTNEEIKHQLPEATIEHKHKK